MNAQLGGWFLVVFFEHTFVQNHKKWFTERYHPGHSGMVILMV
jgi:hypothetical protein